MKKTILLVHIGPVQDFIKSARRCRDLWYGSRLLSEASRHVANALLKESTSTPLEALVFPGRLHPVNDEDVAVANKIQLTLPHAEPERVREVAEHGRERLSTFLIELAAKEFDKIQEELEALNKPPTDLDRELAMRQVRDLMEYFWVAVPFEQEDYSSARKRAESLLAARKNSRNWAAADSMPFGVPKSALDGARESAIAEQVYNSGYKEWMRYRAFGVRGQERLCGIGLLKRLGTPPGEDASSDVPPFHSTSHIASAPTRCRIDRLETYPEWEALLSTLRVHLGAELSHHRARVPSNPRYSVADPRSTDAIRHQVHHALPAGEEAWGYDGLLLYPNRVQTSGPSSLLSGIDLEKGTLTQAAKEIQAAQNNLFRALGVREPFAYYALLLADGDHMGRAIDALDSEDAHQRFSRVLDEEFASRCQDIVSNHGGSLIYAGGDDVLALLPLHTALDCSRAIEERFGAAMEVAFKDSAIPRPTLSAGLAVAHYLEPFGEVRQQASDAERAAKNAGRDRIAISVRKRGNATRTVVGTWRSDTAGTPSLLERIHIWSNVLRSKEVPSALAYKLEDAIVPLMTGSTSMNSGAEDEDEHICRSLIKGVMIRRDFGDAEDKVTELIDQLFAERLRACRETPGGHESAAVRAVTSMAHELRIASIFNEAWETAYALPEGGVNR